MTVQLYSVPGSKKLRDILPQRFERKFYLSPSKVGFAYGLLRQICPLADEYPNEQINSLYFDTVDLDQLERSYSGDYRKDKVRIRWYGKDESLHGEQPVFLELKSRRGFASTKQRLKLLVPVQNLTPDNLNKGIIPRHILMDTLARFGYFPPGLLQPVIKISYWRYRFSEMISGQRVALDYHIRSTMIMPGLSNGAMGLELPGGVIEIKGQVIELPKTLRETRILDIDWTRFSKYAACMDSYIEAPGTIGWLSPSGRII